MCQNAVSKQQAQMRTISIAIKSKDEDYAEALAMALARNMKGRDVDVPGGDPAGYDVVLIDASSEPDGSMTPCDSENVIFLTDAVGEDEKHVYKYGNVMRIAEAVVRTANAAGDSLRVDNDTDIYMFVSPYGGSGCSSCSLGFAEALMLTKGKRTLLLSMAPLGIDRCTNGNDEEDGSFSANDVRALLYHIADGKDMSGLIRSFLEESERGVMSLRDCRGISPLSEATPDLFERSLSTVIKSGLFDAVVIDAGSHITKALLAAATAAKRVFVISDMKRQAGEGRPEGYDKLRELFLNAGITDVISVMNRYNDTPEGECGSDITVEEAEEGVSLAESKRFIGSVDRLCDRFS